jgi:hypothetical protein
VRCLWSDLLHVTSIVFDIPIAPADPDPKKIQGAHGPVYAIEDEITDIESQAFVVGHVLNPIFVSEFV